MPGNVTHELCEQLASLGFDEWQKVNATVSRIWSESFLEWSDAARAEYLETHGPAALGTTGRGLYDLIHS